MKLSEKTRTFSCATDCIVRSKDTHSVIKSALQGARAAVRKAGGKRNVNKPQSLPVPRKVGGFLPYLLPIFAGLSATGALAGGAAGIAKAVNDANAAKKQLEESQRYNQMMLSIAFGKGLKPYKDGLGLQIDFEVKKRQKS